MKKFSRSIPAESFFLQTDSGKRFCLYHAPSTDTNCRGVIIYVHPFGEEMNKSRRMAALQARAFAAIGFGVLQIDLFGCGDSSGDFADARWHTWKCDLAVARTWVEIHVAAPVSLWGLRLGALLALDFARSSEKVFDQIILWQPVLSGESFLTQFLRLQLANEMLAKSHEKTGGTSALRGLLRAGKPLEVAGYELAPSLATAIDGLKIAELAVASSPIHWFEIVAEQGRTIAPAGAKIVTMWKENAIDLHLHLISCPPFWGTQEISECPELLSATTNALAAAHHEL